MSSHGQPTSSCAPSWGLGVSLTTLHSKKNSFFSNCHSGHRTWTDSVNRRPRLRTGSIWLRIGTSGGCGYFGNTMEGECLPLEAVTKQRQVETLQTESTSLCVTVIRKA
jgi:hypothetical protein